jgi:hypothetical protein
MKGRSGATDHALYDTVRGATKDLASNTTTAETTQATGLTVFSGTGFSIGALAKINTNAATYASWTFREQPKFFDIVTYTGTGANRTISHNLGSVPGCIIVKRTDTTGNWNVYHRGLSSAAAIIRLNQTIAQTAVTTMFNSTAPTSTVFSVGTNVDINASGGTYVAYLFAHDAGGFGTSDMDNVISCGSFIADVSGNATVSLGYEPQWVLYKITSTTGNWFILDNMRGLAVNTSGGANGPHLFPNLPDAESPSGNSLSPTATGFQANGITSSATYIYIAIRRGPMKVPTSGTSVFSPNTSSGAEGTAITTNFPLDFGLMAPQSGGQRIVADRLRGIISTATTLPSPRLQTNTTNAEANEYVSRNWSNTGFQVPAAFGGVSTAYYSFRRAPGFMDVVAYSGTGVNDEGKNHNLTVAPELVIIKSRSAASNWRVKTTVIDGTNDVLVLNTTAAKLNDTTSSPTSAVFYVSSSSTENASGSTYIAYLFATVAGVSKVGSYTGTGTTLQINCGFTAGARFVLIKRTDSTGDWYVWDSARGIIAGNDPYLLLNSTAAEVTSTDYIDTAATGFEISSTAPAAINASGGSFIFLAIA